MASEKLTQDRINRLKPREGTVRKVSDGGGLHILVTPNGSKLWRMGYRFDERQPDGSTKTKQKTLALGVYDEKTNGLTEARARASAAKLMLKNGRDPARTADTPDGQDTFKTVALDWHEAHESEWSPKYAALIMARLKEDIFPAFGYLPIGKVNRQDVRAALKKVQERGAIETAHRLASYISAIFLHSDDDNVKDPTPAVRAKLVKRRETKHFKRLPWDKVGRFLVALDQSECEPETRLAMLLTIYTGVRTNETIGATGDEFEHMRSSRKALWRLSKERMKMDREHLVPLSKQARAIAEELLESKGEGYLFPKADGRRGHMSNNTMLFHCYAMGFRNKTTMHGFRAVFSTLANESGLWAPDVIEVQLAHAEKSKTRRAYNSAEHLPKRRELMQWWADQLDLAKAKARGRTVAELLGPDPI